MFSRASTFEPSAETNDRLSLLTMIFDFFGSIFLSSVLGRLQVCSGAGNSRPASGQRGTRFAPGEETAFQKCEQKPEQKRGDADGDDSRIYAIEIQHFASGLDHVTHALASIQHLCQYHVGPADVIEDSERREIAGNDARNTSHNACRCFAPSV